ncbi:pentapeptide repeat-containing protein [Pseudanabaena sp. ABRG5-3]|uniref:pentapeptide repeat-containing protein n=1 Tax=Pseudanabaena sp. ABRG5-3 TaxID=685565 RepID=UPI000DC70C49|nr:pentapeptide repeat-containing protein [Pseudanabaena sp. ABRG5-3]BBC22703.1 pentapeptide repeat protein [Pseudanabaena sp. ABRG5-3]
MASNRNIPQKGQGANEPEHNRQSVDADAASVDWMIMSDLSTRIGGSSQSKQQPQQDAKNLPSSPTPQAFNNQLGDDDLEDVEWLRSLGLDEPIERSTNQKNTGSDSLDSNAQNSNPVSDIDWLIVSDLKTRMDSPEVDSINSGYQNTFSSNVTPQAMDLDGLDGLDSLLDDDLGLDGLEFTGDSDFSELDSLDDLGFGTSESLTSNELQDELDITEGKILGLSEFLDDSLEADNSVNNNWDEILEVTENNDRQFSPPPNLGMIEDSFEVPTQITGFVSNDQSLDLNYDENVDLSSDQLSEFISNEDIQEEPLANDLEISDELLVEDFLAESVEEVAIESFADDQFQDILEEPQDISVHKEVEAINDLVEDLGISLEDGFGEDLGTSLEDGFDEDLGASLDNGFGDFQPIAASEVNTVEDESFWGEANVTNLDAEPVNDNNEDVFASDWQPLTTDTENNIDDSIWDSAASIVVEEVSSTSIDNAFGTFDDVAIAPPTDQSGLDIGLEENVGFDLPSDNDADWSAELEAVIDAETENNSNWDLAPEVEVSSPDADLDSEIANDLQWNVDLETPTIDPDIAVNQDTVWHSELEVENANSHEEWNEELLTELRTEDEVYVEEALTELRTEDEVYNELGWNAELESVGIDHNIDHNVDLLDSYESDLAEGLIAEPTNQNFDFSDNLDEDDFAIANGTYNISPNNLIENTDDAELSNPDSYQPQNLSTTNFQPPENLIDQASEWESFSEAFSGQITDSDFDGDFANYVVKPVEPVQIAPPQNLNNPEDAAYFADLDSMIDDDFDLASFDESGFSESPPIPNDYVSTTLTPSRGAVPPPVDSSSLGVTPPPSITPVNFIPPNNPASNPLPDSLTDGLLNDDYDLEVDLREEALANDLLNGYTDSDAFDNPVPQGESFANTPLQSSPPTSFDMSTIDHDFLDDFDLDSMDTQLTGSDFDSVSPAAISTGLTPPAPPSAPASPIAPSINQDITFPSVGNPPTSPPPPPPFLPPLPPKRSHTQPKASSSSSSSSSLGHQPPSRNRPSNQMRDDDFDNFHSQPNLNKSRKPINPIDEGWSELLDADTVLSGVLKSPTGSPYSDPSGTLPPKVGGNVGASAGRASQGRDRNASSNPKRRDTGLPDFNDLGLEIHDDNTDWSGLLDSGDLSDSITSISSSELPSRIRTAPLAASPRSEISGISETREIPRDRRKTIAGFDSTQARMAATPDQIDFNRFTDDSYDAYGYESQAQPEPATPKKQTKMTMPSVSLESLWQDYLKIPVIGLGAIGSVFLLYVFLNRPIFDIGLRWGIFKDASGKDFTNADFRGAKLDNVDFSKAILTGAKMQDASLVGANFQEANLDGVNFTKANLNRARLIKASVIWAEFNNAQMNLVDLAGADLTLSNFASAKMEGTNLKDAKIGAQGTDKATKFNSKTLLSWQIVNQPLEGRNLADQDLSGLNLSFTSLKRANLSNTKLNYTDLTSTDLRGANLTGSQVNGANWSGAKLAGINLTNVVFDKTKLPKTDEETICPNGKKGPCQF